MPGLYAGDDFDLAGFLVGVAERDGLLDNASITPGDCLVGIPSGGPAYQRVLPGAAGFQYRCRPFGAVPAVWRLGATGWARNCWRATAVITPCSSRRWGVIKGLAHITGGGLPGKMPAILPGHLAASFQTGSWEIPPIFTLIQAEGRVSPEEMYRVFNMGLGMVAVCREEDIDRIWAAAPDAVVVGRVVERSGDQQVIFAD